MDRAFFYTSLLCLASSEITLQRFSGASQPAGREFADAGVLMHALAAKDQVKERAHISGDIPRMMVFLTNRCGIGSRVGGLLSL